MSFIIPFGAFRYTIMSFGLKSVGATYQRGIEWCLHTELGHNARAYVDDVVVNTREDEVPISDLVETFNNLRYPHKNYSGIWSPNKELTLTQRRC
jgi:hypothetical protein